MAPTHEILIRADVPGALEGEEDCGLIRRVIGTALALEGVRCACEVDVLLTDDRGIQALNRETRGVDAPTDVLSFPQWELEPGQPPTEEYADPGSGRTPLGDMAVSMERVSAQAREYGHSRRRELAYLVVHSTLHLLGYDHMDNAAMQRQMRAREEAILAQLSLGRREAGEEGEEHI